MVFENEVQVIAKRIAQHQDEVIFGMIEHVVTERGIKTQITLNEESIVEALEKQISKKPRESECDDGLSRNCPNCCDVVTKMDSEYVCKWCGQKLDWSDEE